MTPPLIKIATPKEVQRFSGDNIVSLQSVQQALLKEGFNVKAVEHYLLFYQDFRNNMIYSQDVRGPKNWTGHDTRGHLELALSRFKEDAAFYLTNCKKPYLAITQNDRYGRGHVDAVSQVLQDIGFVVERIELTK